MTTTSSILFYKSNLDMGFVDPMVDAYCPIKHTSYSCGPILSITVLDTVDLSTIQKIERKQRYSFGRRLSSFDQAETQRETETEDEEMKMSDNNNKKTKKSALLGRLCFLLLVIVKIRAKKHKNNKKLIERTSNNRHIPLDRDDTLSTQSMETYYEEFGPLPDDLAFRRHRRTTTTTTTTQAGGVVVVEKQPCPKQRRNKLSVEPPSLESLFSGIIVTGRSGKVNRNDAFLFGLSKSRSRVHAPSIRSW